MPQHPVVVVAPERTAIGTFGGSLKEIPAPDLGAVVLNDMYGDRLERVVLHGSRARGDAHEESDYDVAVFLGSMPDRVAELYRLADLSTKIIVE
jgi:acetyl-CoA acetyltransferase